MISATLVALSAFILSASARELQSQNPSFFNAGIQGCISVAANADGEAAAFKGDTALAQLKSSATKCCLDVTGGVNADGTKLQIWTCSGGPNQQWVNTLAGSFRWSGTNKCVDLTGGSMTDETQLQIWTCDDNNANQKWAATSDPDFGGPQIILGGNTTNQPDPIRGQPFCVGAASDADGAEVVLVGCGISNAGPNFPNANFTWMAPFAPLTGTISTFGNKCLDVPNGSNVNGVKLQIWTCAAGNTNQMFQIGRQQVQWAGSGKCLDLTGGNSTIGNPIQLWDCSTNNNINQIWQLDTVQV
ncbi:ricin B lectin domain-containing protein [Mycena leptocephala]|nr:ricin B lectin domain-containing protein [Mycena leptocephala]